VGTECLQAEALKVLVASKMDLDLDVVVLQTIDSTNSWGLQQTKLGRVLPFVCFAEEQTSGKGRRGKHWHMPANSNVAMSLVWSFDCLFESQHLLPLAIAMALVDALEDLGLKQVQIKWPNDVYVQGKKIAGILIETRPIKNDSVTAATIDSKAVAVVIGLGLNFQMQQYEPVPGEEPLVFTDVCEQARLQNIVVQPDRNVIASAVLCNMISVCQHFEKVAYESLQRFRSNYDFCRQKKVDIVLDNNDVLSGVAQGVSDNAELLVLVEGEQLAFNSAEVSVRAGKA